MFENKDKKQIENIINKIYKEICKELLLNNEELQRYVKKNLNSIVEIIYNAVKQSTLDKIFITQKFIITQFKKLKQQNKHKIIDTYKNQIYNICDETKY